jgi:hypothetical protein
LPNDVPDCTALRASRRSRHDYLIETKSFFGHQEVLDDGCARTHCHLLRCPSVADPLSRYRVRSHGHVQEEIAAVRLRQDADVEISNEDLAGPNRLPGLAV